MSEAWPPCPTGKRQRHAITFLFTEPDAPVLMVCKHCGMREHTDFDGPIPMDDLDAADILRLTQQR